MNRKASDRLAVVTRDRAQWTAWTIDNRVVELHIQPPQVVGDVDSVHLAQVERIDRNLDAAFVDLGSGISGLLPLDDTKPGLIEGAKVVVQVKRVAGGGKSARLTQHLGLAGCYLILLPDRRGITVSDRIADKSERRRLSHLVQSHGQSGEGFILRTAAAGADGHELLSEMIRLREQRQRLEDLSKSRNAPGLLLPGVSAVQRIVRDSGASFSEIVVDSRRETEGLRAWCRVHAPLFSEKIVHRRTQDWEVTPEEIRAQAEDALEPHVELPSGGLMLVEPGETLTAIDVDTARHRSSAGDAQAEQVFLKTNLEAADEISRQLRLRAIAGIIVIDFVNMRDPAHRRRVLDRLKAVVADDPARCWVGSMSRLGLVELTRRRQGPSLAEALSEACLHCGGTGRKMRELQPLIDG